MRYPLVSGQKKPVRKASVAELDWVGISILFGALLVLSGILSSLIALRFGAPLLLVFLLVGMVAGESGPFGIHFDNVGVAYTVGSVALALILFDGGLRTRMSAIRSVLAPAGLLATVGVLITTVITAPFAAYALNLGSTEALLVGAIVGSTDVAAVFFLIHAGGLRLRPRVSATLEVESSTNDPFAIFLTLTLVDILLAGTKSWQSIGVLLVEQIVVGAVVGVFGGRAMVFVLNRLGLPQGLHAPFVATGALVVFGVAQVTHGSGFFAVYLAGLVVGNQATRAHNTVVVFLDAATWLAQIAMFVLLGMLAWPERLPEHALPAIAVALALTFIARPIAVFVCLAPFRFPNREKLFISWVGLRGAVGIFLASVPLLVGLPNATLYFDVGFVVVLMSLLVQGWTIAAAARELRIALPRADVTAQRIEIDLPGQLSQEMVGYPINASSPYLRRGITPSWAKLNFVVRDEHILTPEEAGGVRANDYVYFLAPPEKAQALDRFFVEMPAPANPDPQLLGDFFVSGEVTLGVLSEIYGLTIAADEAAWTLADYFETRLHRDVHVGDVVKLGVVALAAHTVAAGRPITVGLQLAEPEPAAMLPLRTRIKRRARRLWLQKAMRPWQRLRARLRP